MSTVPAAAETSGRSANPLAERGSALALLSPAVRNLGLEPLAIAAQAGDGEANIAAVIMEQAGA